MHRKDKGPSIQSRKGIIDKIGLSLLRLLAKRTPRAAIAALKDQFGAYIDRKEPFNGKRGRKESLREYWSRLLTDNDYWH